MLHGTGEEEPDVEQHVVPDDAVEATWLVESEEVFQECVLVLVVERVEPVASPVLGDDADDAVFLWFDAGRLDVHHEFVVVHWFSGVLG